MVRHLKEIIVRADKGNKRVRTFDVEAVKEALERFNEEVPQNRKPIGFQVGR